MTSIAADKLPGALKASLAPIYIVAGDETLVIEESCDLIRSAAKKNGFEDREIYHVDNQFDWSTLLQISQSLSLFGSKRLIELRLNNKVNDKGRKALVEYAEHPSDADILLIISPKIERSTQKAKWFTKLTKAGCFVQAWPVNSTQLPRWLIQRAKRKGLTLNQDAVELLSSRVEGNLLAAAQEIEKLALLTDDGNIDGHLVAQSVANSSRYDVYDLVDKALIGDSRNATRTLSGLKSEGIEVPVILWALTREIRTLIQISRALDNGKNLATAAKAHGIWESRHGIIKNAMQRLKKNQLNLLLRKAYRVDRAAKGMDSSDPWEGCLEIVLNLSGVNPLTAATERVALSV